MGQRQMSNYRAMQCPLDEDLSSLSRFLREHGVVHRITEERGQQVLWTRDAEQAALVRAVYAQGLAQQHKTPGQQTLDREPGRAQRKAHWQQLLQRVPVTLLVLLITALVALLTGLGTNINTLKWLTFNPLVVEGRALSLLPVDLAQWWRLLTPMFLHFGWLHLAFNALWFWELGRRIEMRSGGIWLLGLTVLFALVSNLAQWLFGGAAIFGGLSGVLYGLLGYCWLYQLLAPNSYFALPKGVVVMMLGWLLLCMSGLVELLGFGAIANAAHVGGLLIGCACGAIAGALQRGR